MTFSFKLVDSPPIDLTTEPVFRVITYDWFGRFLRCSVKDKSALFSGLPKTLEIWTQRNDDPPAHMHLVFESIKLSWPEVDIETIAAPIFSEGE